MFSVYNIFPFFLLLASSVLQLAALFYVCTSKVKGVGEGGQGGTRASPLSKVGGAQVGLCPPPTFGHSKCSNFTICSYFLVKNTIFFKIFLGSLRSPTLINQYFLNFANLKLSNIFFIYSS